MRAEEAIKILKKNGWVLIRIKGSHYVMDKLNRTVVVPFHSSKDLGIGLLKNIEKTTGVKLK